MGDGGALNEHDTQAREAVRERIRNAVNDVNAAMVRAKELGLGAKLAIASDIDDATFIAVAIATGDLESISESDILSGGNVAHAGPEVIDLPFVLDPAEAGRLAGEILTKVADYGASIAGTRYRRMTSYDPRCHFKFKEPRCGYVGPETDCDKTSEACAERFNLENFGGFPGIPTPRLCLHEHVTAELARGVETYRCADCNVPMKREGNWYVPIDRGPSAPMPPPASKYEAWKIPREKFAKPILQTSTPISELDLGERHPDLTLLRSNDAIAYRCEGCSQVKDRLVRISVKGLLLRLEICEDCATLALRALEANR